MGGSPETGWVQDVAVNSRASIHLDGVDDVIIIEGNVNVLASVGDELAKHLATASQAKFPEYHLTPEVYKSRGAIAIRPRKVIAWTDIIKDPTRFRFDS